MPHGRSPNSRRLQPAVTEQLTPFRPHRIKGDFPYSNVGYRVTMSVVMNLARPCSVASLAYFAPARSLAPNGRHASIIEFDQVDP